MSDNKRIAKNTLFLYFRMLLTMGVSLYTSRVILDKLGVDDYGIYNVVGGVVGMLSFINGTLSIGTMRFLTTELGKKDYKQLKKTFNTAFYTHLGIGLILALLLETIGLWFVYNKLIIPPERLHAAVFAYHISILTSIISITQVPYTSIIMAHERMDVYAYISIFEAFAKLLVVYLLCLTVHDKLIIFAILIAVLQFLVAMSYRVFSVKNFIESKLELLFDCSIFKSLMGFSGWNIMANISETLKLQGYLVLLNMFFQPFVVAAQAIGNQVAGAMMQFVSNFRTAINPQIIKLYAAGEYEDSKRLTLNTTILVYDLVLLLGLPSIFVMETIMKIWLVEVPPYAVIFTQCIIAQRILSTFDAAFYIPMMAEGKIKTNSMLASISGPGIFVILYLLFKIGASVMWLQYAGFFSLAIFGFIIKPYLLVHDEKGYGYSDFKHCFLTCLKVTLSSIFLSYIFYMLIGNSTIMTSFFLFLCSFLCVIICSTIFMDKITRYKIRYAITNRIRNKMSRKCE